MQKITLSHSVTKSEQTGVLARREDSRFRFFHSLRPSVAPALWISCGCSEFVTDGPAHQEFPCRRPAVTCVRQCPLQSLLQTLPGVKGDICHARSVMDGTGARLPLPRRCNHCTGNRNVIPGGGAQRRKGFADDRNSGAIASSTCHDFDPIVASLEGVNKNYGSIKALRGVDFRVRAGEVVALLGPNGAGKTTAVKLLLGLMLPNSGRARVFGGDPSNPENRMRTGAMLQVGRVPETLRVREHIDLFSTYYPKPMASADVLAAAGLEI